MPEYDATARFTHGTTVAITTQSGSKYNIQCFGRSRIEMEDPFSGRKRRMGSFVSESIRRGKSLYVHFDGDQGDVYTSAVMGLVVDGRKIF